MIPDVSSAFGLQLHTPFALPDLADVGGAFVRVEIEAGRVGDAGWRGRRYVHPDGLALESDADTIRITDERSPPGLIELLTLGLGVTGVLSARGVGVLHATTVRLDRDVAIVGPSGVGKSSVTAALLKRGAKLVADDIAALEPQGVRPGIGRLKLWRDTAEHFGFSCETPVRAGIDKFLVQVPVETEIQPLTELLMLQRGPLAVERMQVSATDLLANHRVPQLADPVVWLKAVGALARLPVTRVCLPGPLEAVEDAIDRWLR